MHSFGSALGGYTLNRAGFPMLGAVGGAVILFALASLFFRRPA